VRLQLFSNYCEGKNVTQPS